MLLQHAWLAPLSKPTTITEEDEEAASGPVSESENSSDAEIKTPTSEKSECDMSKGLKLPYDVIDPEVAEWVLQALEKRRLGKLAKAEKPALHAAPLDAVAAERTPRGVLASVNSTVPLDTAATEAALHG